MKTKIILLGAGPFILPIFKKLQASEIEIEAVVTQPDAQRDRGKKLKSQEVALLAEEAGLPVLKPQDITSIVEELQQMGADLLLTASYGQYLKKAVRDFCPHKSFNIHPSLLPLYRGATPVNAALSQGQKTTGVTLYKMEKEMDAGAMAAQVTCPILENETADLLLLRLAKLGADLAIETLPKIVNHEITLQEQDHATASHCHKLKKQDAFINWQLSAEEIHNRIRAHHPWPGSRCQHKGTTLSLFDSELGESSGDQAPPGSICKITNEFVQVACNPGTLKLKSFQLAGKKKLGAKEFLNGYALAEDELFEAI
jgi:methionyl-tRNA formyltransferase